MVVPMTALMTVTMSASENVSCRAATACGLVTSLMKAPRPSLRDFQMTAATGMRTMRHSHAAAMPGPSQPRGHAGGAGVRPALSGGRVSGGRQGCALICVMMPVSLSKNLVATAAQPPRSSMVNRPDGVGKFEKVASTVRIDGP